MTSYTIKIFSYRNQKREKKTSTKKQCRKASLSHLNHGSVERVLSYANNKNVMLKMPKLTT